MKYRGYTIRAHQFEEDFGNWYAIVYAPSPSIFVFEVNGRGKEFVQTRKEIYARAKLRIDAILTAQRKGE